MSEVGAEGVVSLVQADDEYEARDLVLVVGLLDAADRVPARVAWTHERVNGGGSAVGAARKRAGR